MVNLGGVIAANGNSQKKTFHNINKISMSHHVLTVDYKDPSAPSKLEVSLRSSGFALIKNHPISRELIDRAYEEWESFFNNKNKFNYVFNKKTQDGYFPFLTENAKNSSVKDLKEFYHYYPWGRLPSRLSESTITLYNDLVNLSIELLQWIESSCPAHIKKNFSAPLKSMIRGSQSNLFRIIHYPPLGKNADKKALRAAPHEDINLITVLLAGSEPGLQAMDTNGKWHDISCDKNMLVVNSGDMLSMASNNYYPSTTHRVINPQKSKNVSRYSMPLFLHPKDSVVLNETHTARSYLDERLKEIGLK